MSGDSLLDHHIGELNRSVPEAKKQFKSAMRDLRLGMPSLHTKDDQFILDGIVIESTKHMKNYQK